MAAKASALTIEQASKLSAEAIKKESKADQKAKAEEEKRKDLRILIKRVERTKRKYVTVIQGLEGFGASRFVVQLLAFMILSDTGVDLKAAAKLFVPHMARDRTQSSTMLCRSRSRGP